MFHHSEIAGTPTPARCYRITTAAGARTDEGYTTGAALASYAHLHFSSEPRLARAFVERCARGAPHRGA
jgi:cobyrinic acid a,c-diamide synthase